MRSLLAALVLVLSACGPAPAPFEPLCAPEERRSCYCASGAPGAQFCGAGQRHFEACDCGHELGDSGPPRDGGRGDAGTDAAIVDGGPPDGGDECSIVAQSGCEPGEACRLTRLPAGLASECVRSGTLLDGEQLPGVEGGCLTRDDAGAYDACALGLVCSSARGWCVRYCFVGDRPEQCPPSRGFVTACEPLEPGFPIGLCEPTSTPAP